MTASAIARLKVVLDHVKPAVRRRLEVPLTMRLDRLHLVLQAAIGWTNSHLYEIRAGDVGWGMVDPDGGDGLLDAAKVQLIDLLEGAGAKTFKYFYDFGDGWEHTIKVERVIYAVPGLLYPILIDGSGACPPEDVGGPLGYTDLIEALADPTHESHAELKHWIGGSFDPLAFDLDDHRMAVDALARQWARRPKAVRG